MHPIFSSFQRVLLGAVAVAALCLSVASSINAETGPIAPVAKANVRSEATNVHVLLVADTEDVHYDAAGNLIGGIGRAVGKDVEALEKFLAMVKKAHPELQDRIKVTALTGRNARPENIRAYYRDLKCGPNDNLFFYLSSHGGMRRGAESAEGAHILAVCSKLRADGQMSRTEIRQLMEQKRPRGIILITDVCSNYGPEDGQPIDRRVRRSLPGTAPNTASVRNLLFRAPRLVNITAAQDGTPARPVHVGRAFGGAESAFTVALLHVLCDTDRDFATWEQFFPALDAETFKASGRSHRPRHFGLSEHRGGASRPAPAPVREPETGPITRIGPDTGPVE